LVMSGRPGTIVTEIKVDMGDRDNPMHRRKLPQLGTHVTELMELLRLDAHADVH